jgi:hypothetical protein
MKEFQENNSFNTALEHQNIEVKLLIAVSF